MVMRKLYRMGPAWNSNPVKRIIINEGKILRPGWQDRISRVFASEPWELGFWPMLEKPIIRQIKKDKRKPVDLDAFRGGFWLISENCKSVFEQVDKDAFSFVACEHFASDETRTDLWLCAVIRQVDAINEEASHVKIIETPNWHRTYRFDLPYHMVFDGKRIAPHHHIFAMAYNLRTIIADDIMQIAVKSAGLRNIHFQEVIYQPPKKYHIEPSNSDH